MKPKYSNLHLVPRSHRYVTPETCRDCNNRAYQMLEYRPNCPVCEGGLSVCAVCGLFEGGLTTECPGESSFDKSADVYHKKLDFIGNSWVTIVPETKESGFNFKGWLEA